MKIGTVRGDDILERLDELMDAGVTLDNLDDGRSLSSEIRDKVLSANVYIHSFAIADAGAARRARRSSSRAEPPTRVSCSRR